MTIKEMRTELTLLLQPILGPSEGAATADVIVQDIKDCSYTDMVVNSHRELLPETQERMLKAARQVTEGCPVQYVLGKAYFHGRRFCVDSSTLIPRPETSQLVDIIEKEATGRSDLRVLDIGTGSGCIAISLALDLSFPRVVAIDNSPQALRCAEDNAKRLNAKVEFLDANALHLSTGPLKDATFDIIVSNPPYILMSEKKDMEARVIDYEPSSALFVPDSDPLMFYRPIIHYSDKALAPKGKLYLECNPLSIKEVVSEARKSGLDAYSINDYKSTPRFVIAEKE